MTGIFAPEVWADGDDTDNIPNADDLNTEWRDSLNFLLGYTRPIAFVYSTTGTTITTSETNVPFNNERLIRGGMIHSTSTNNHQITVPYTGQYHGFAWGGFNTISTLSTRLVIRVKKNGTNIANAGMKPENTGGWNIHCSLTLNATAGDVITMIMVTTSGTAVMGSTLISAPRLGLYYAGEYV
jgi:hypothetical protein